MTNLWGSGAKVRDKFTVALIQMSCGPEPADNLAKALDRVALASHNGADVVCLPELFQTQYFCQREDAALFDLAEPIPGAGTEKLAAAARQNKVVLIASLFEKRAPGLYHNTAAIFDGDGDSDGALVGIYRKMHIPTIRSTTKNFISLPEISASRPSILPPENSARWFAGTSGIPRVRASQHSREPAFFFIPRLSDGIPGRRLNSAQRNTMPGAPSNERTRLRTAFMSAW